MALGTVPDFFWLRAYVLDMNLKQLIERAESQSAEIEMSNETLAAEIKLLEGATDPTLLRRLSDLQAKLFAQNAGLLTNLAKHYNRGSQLTDDETDEVANAVFEAARRYDPSRGSKFSSCLAFCVQSALQREHAFLHGRSQAVYARAKAKLNHPERHRPEELARAEALLRGNKPFLEEMDSPEMSVEDLIFRLTGQRLDEEKSENMLALLAEAVSTDVLTMREKSVLASILEPRKAVTEYGLSTDDAVARNLHMERIVADVERQRIFIKIQDFICERDPSLAPDGWAKGQKGIKVPGREGEVMGLYGPLTAEEVQNLQKITGHRRAKGPRTVEPAPRNRPGADESETAMIDNLFSQAAEQTPPGEEQSQSTELEQSVEQSEGRRKTQAIGGIRF